MVLLVVYLVTLAPGVTFWDAGEFIAAAHGLGIPHPPGTPLVIATGRVWTMLLGHVAGVARAMNLLSAVCTAAAGATTAWLVVREAGSARDSAWGAVAGALSAGLMSTVWASATETEVYAVSLLHVVVMLACAARAADDRDGRWLLCTAYVIALAPVLHLSALVGAPAAIALAARRRGGRWLLDRVLLLGGVMIAAAGMGRMSWVLAGVGAVAAAASAFMREKVPVPRSAQDDSEVPRSSRHDIARVAAAMALTALASSAVLIMLVRARHDPPINQGNPSSLTALADVVARRQYDVAPLWPRQAPAWLQVATLGQYADWQFALTWGRGIFTTPARVLVTGIFLLLGVGGWNAMRRDAKRVAEALAILAVCGSLGVCAYLNLKSGATIGYGIVPAGAHEARERDYFFVLGFWAWGVFAGYGALAVVRARAWPAWLVLSVVVIPLVANWTANDRPRGAGATAARDVALALLTSAPGNAMLFVAGDNDTYPLWYLQQVEHVRTDVTPVTIPLLPADWYGAEIGRRTGLRWPAAGVVPGARWQHQELAAKIAESARRSGRPVAVSPSLTSSERALLGSRWALAGAVYVASGPADGSKVPPTIDHQEAPLAVRALAPRRRARATLPDDVSEMMFSLLDCYRLGRLSQGKSPERDSLEVRCNVR